ncbi:hypothetical protein M378DRAFT_163717 [Amanita muscaria Koide BX008]|uniref:Uncharacterized protein n=1 Tax=Amanita muscaria (strain Koide BX008) TaxID=946122 RepID=A0A0C2X5L7_AMAMK|nr:hypothetical protein M378DRAFT_163717 [Amanita muscaria Koide BX008]
MPPTRTESKRAGLRNDPKKRQRPEELVQENQNDTAKRVHTTEAEGGLRATVTKRQKKAEVSRPQAAIRRSTRKTKSTKTDQSYHAKTDGKQTNLPSPQANNISVVEVAEVVKRLNAEIAEVSSLMTDSLSYRRLPGSGSTFGVALNELHDYLGAQLCNELQRRSNMDPDPLITRITLQTGLVNTCSRIIVISDWDHPLWGNKDYIFSRIVSNMERVDQVVPDTWREQTRTNTTVSLHENQKVNEKYLTEVLLKLITAVGGSLQSEVTLPSQYNAKLEGIARQAIELQKIFSKDVSSTGLVTYTIPCDTEFDPSQMEDVKWDDSAIATAPLGRVICTVELGLRCRKRLDSGSEVGVAIKPKVVLAAALEACSTVLEKKIKQLEVKMAELYQRLQKNAEKLSSMEVEANRRNVDHARNIVRLEARIVELDQLLQKRGIEGIANEQVHVLSEAQGVERRQAATGLRDISVEGEQTHEPSAFGGKADSISVAEVAELVKILNAQIEQVSIFVADSLSYEETPSSCEEVRIALDELYDHVGQWLYSNLRSRSERKMEPDPLITQITIQTGLVNVCCGIINGSPPLINGSTLSRMNRDVAGASQDATDALRALGHSHTALSQSERKEAVQKYLMELLLKLITAAGGSLETLQSQYNEKVEDITKKAIELHRTVSQDVRSVELIAYTIPCDTGFDPSQMEDTEGGGDMTTASIPGGNVVCTLEMGLRCRKKAQAKQSGFFGGERDSVSMKAKVVLDATLETEIPK